MSFSDDVLFPTKISYGSSSYYGGRKIRVIEVPGDEKRWIYQAHSKRRFNVSMGIRDEDDLNAVLKIWESHGQMAEGFLYKDFADYKSCAPTGTPSHTDCTLGVGNGVLQDFQLLKTFISGSKTYAKPILKPKTGTTKIGLNGVNTLPGWTVSTTTGNVHFTSPVSNGVTVSAGFEYYVPVRFDIEELEINLSHFKKGQLPDIMLKELLRP